MGRLGELVKKLTTITFLCCLMFLASCGASAEVKQEARERLEEYKPMFEQKVEEVYGPDAKLKNVKCDVNAYIDIFDDTH